MTGGFVQSRRIRKLMPHNARISSAADEPKRLLIENLALLEQVVRRVAHRHHLRNADAEELLGAIRLKLIENDYAVLRRFEGRATLSTYLTAVVTRHLLDERNARWGKWRPSLYAKRLGATAIQLELLMTREGLSFREAAEMLRTNHHVAESDEQLYQISLGFPHRSRRRFVEAKVLDQVASEQRADDVIEGDRRVALAEKTAAALQAALARLDRRDRVLLRLCFEKGLQLSEVAGAMQLEAKRLYRHRERVLSVLRRELERHGVSREDVQDITGGDVDVPGGN
jgi:RNA polymerase sigma factor (sigma-70 family)